MVLGPFKSEASRFWPASIYGCRVRISLCSVWLRSPNDRCNLGQMMMKLKDFLIIARAVAVIGTSNKANHTKAHNS
jgi:hypothetical protein